MIEQDISQAEPIANPSTLWPTLGALDEGFVFKNPAAKLSPCLVQASNGSWQTKIRRSHANYSF